MGNGKCEKENGNRKMEIKRCGIRNEKGEMKREKCVMEKVNNGK